MALAASADPHVRASGRRPLGFPARRPPETGLSTYHADDEHLGGRGGHSARPRRSAANWRILAGWPRARPGHMLERLGRAFPELPVPEQVPTVQVARRFGSQVELVAPPYRSLSVLSTLRERDDLPLGAVILGRGDTTIAVLAELTAYVHRWPWVVPCLVLRSGDGPLEPLLMLVTELRDRLGVVKEAFDYYDASRLVGAIRRRPVPSAVGLATWIATRLGDEALKAPLCSQFREAIEGTPASASASISTFSRFFARYGRYTARDWRAIAHLSLHTAAVASQSPMLPLRTARDHARRYLGLSYHVMAERLGWEWVLEGALRTGAYL